jgi:hypothetical protein
MFVSNKMCISLVVDNCNIVSTPIYDGRAWISYDHADHLAELRWP